MNICGFSVKIYNTHTKPNKHFWLFLKLAKALGGGVRRNTIFVMKMRLGHTYEELVNMESLLDAWQEFLRGKRNKNDVQEFQLHLMDNILSLHGDLINENYRHGD